MSTNTYFYSNLPVYKTSLSDVLGSPFHFSKVPKNWYIVAVDIQRSTQAVKHDLLRSVKLSAAMCVAAVKDELNTVDSHLQVPYFFGGDGVTFLVPKKYKTRVELILENVRSLVFKSYFLKLRVGSLQMRTLYENGEATLKISKLQLSPNIILPLAVGDALIKVESYLKSKARGHDIDPRQQMFVDYSISKDRQIEIAKGNKEKHIFCFIVYPKTFDSSLELLHAISKKMDEFFGDYNTRFPFSLNNLKNCDALFDKHFDMLLNSKKNMMNRLIMSVFSKIKYLRVHSKLIEKALKDVKHSALALSIDGGFSDVVKITEAQKKEFLEYLEALEQEEKIIFGYHTSKCSIINASSYLNYQGWQHYVDGCNGGYSKAAKMFKLKSGVIGAR